MEVKAQHGVPRQTSLVDASRHTLSRLHPLPAVAVALHPSAEQESRLDQRDGRPASAPSMARTLNTP